MKNKIAKYLFLTALLFPAGCARPNPFPSTVKSDVPLNIELVEIYDGRNSLTSYLIFVDKTTGYRYIRFYNGGVCRLDDKRKEDK